MSVYTISGDLNGKWQHLKADTAEQAEEQVDKLHQLGVFPVHIKKDGKLIETPEELEQLKAAESDKPSI